MIKTQQAVSSRYFSKKLLLIPLVGIVLLIASFFLSSTIHDRKNLLDKAKDDIVLAWSGAQTFIGPMLIVPYTEVLQEIHPLTKVPFEKNVLKYVLIMPENLEVTNAINPEIRHRGIFDVMVYQATIECQCSFVPSDYNADANRTMHWDQAKVIVCIDDVRGFNDVKILANGADIPVRSGSAQLQDKLPGAHGQFAITNLSESLTIKVHLNIKGSETLNVCPIAKSNTINFKANWADPSFIGQFLPNSKNITKKDFQAHWQISSLATGLPAGFDLIGLTANNLTKNNADDLYSSSSSNTSKLQYQGIDKNTFSKTIGVKFLKTADHYQQAERTTKYIFLFILYTFLVFFLYELVKQINIHILQYCLTGASLLCFPLLLTAFAEHMSFGVAYLIASLAIIGQIAFYAFGLFYKTSERISFVSLLVGLYTYLFVVLKLEEIAFLIGAIGMFAAISAAMYFTKNMNWAEKR